MRRALLSAGFLIASGLFLLGFLLIEDHFGTAVFTYVIAIMIFAVTFDYLMDEREEVKTMSREEISQEHMEAQIAWNKETFGPDRPVEGVLDHLGKELQELHADPQDPMEWADMLVLVIDGASRAGLSPKELIQAYHRKMEINRARKWPDWRTADPTKAIEHIRD